MVNSSSHMNVSINASAADGCLLSRPGSVIFSTFALVHVSFLAALCLLVFYRGLKKWRQTSPASGAASMSHYDAFTYHLVAMETIGLLGAILACYAVYGQDPGVLIISDYVFGFLWYGEILFHCLTCLERYLAVVHPITYIGLRSQRGVRIRNAGVACVWLFCPTCTVLIMKLDLSSMDLAVMFSALAVVSFCNVSLLWVLIGPGPGQRADKKEANRFKQRAFFTIVCILVVLLLRLVSNLVLEILHVSQQSYGCVMEATLYWFNLPSSVVLPFLFLHKEWGGSLKKASTERQQ